MLNRDGLVPHTTASAMAEQYRESIERFRAAATELHGAMERLSEVFCQNGGYGYDFDVKLSHRTHEYHIGKGLDSLVDRFKRNCWGILVEKLDIRKIMSQRDRQMLDAQLEGKKDHYIQGTGTVPLAPLPDITAENVMDLLQSLIGRAGEFFAQKVAEEYEYWRPWRTEYATDDTGRLAERVIKQYAMDGYSSHYGWSIDHDARGHLQSLDSIFHALDGRGIPQEHDGQLLTALRAAGPDGKGETPYFRFRCFHNRNLHLRFMRLDLLAEFNRLAGRPDVIPQRKRSPRHTTAV